MTPDITEATVERVADYCEVHGADHDAAGGEANRVAFAEAAALLRALRARLTEVERERMDLFEYTYRPTSAAEEVRSRANVARAMLDARIALGLTQARAAELAGTKQARLSEIESFKGNPRFSTLDKIARVLGLMVVLVPRNQTIASTAFPAEALGFRVSNPERGGTP